MYAIPKDMHPLNVAVRMRIIAAPGTSRHEAVFAAQSEYGVCEQAAKSSGRSDHAVVF